MTRWDQEDKYMPDTLRELERGRQSNGAEDYLRMQENCREGVNL